MAAGENAHGQGHLPGELPTQQLAGKDAEFDVTAKSIEAPGAVTIDDEFAKSLGLESLDKLKDAVQERIGASTPAMSRQKLKRALLDELDEHAQVRAAADAGRGGVQQRLEDGRRAICRASATTFADEDTTEEKARRNTAGSPSGACGSAWCSPRSARRTRSR